MTIESKIASIYIANPEYIPELCEELGHVSNIIDDMVFSSQQKRDVCFARDIWFEPQIIPFNSISEAVRILRQAGKFWYLHPISQIRRSRLIESQLRKAPPLESHFPVNGDMPSIGGFTLLDQTTLVFSRQRLKQWPDGQCFFIEDKINPPNRAYLKLWEALTLCGKYPKTGDRVLDLGASPGGWTYVMQSLGANVTAVDKAPLDPKIAALPHVEFVKQSAFALNPMKIEQSYDWVLSDVACYPDRAYTLIMQWIASGRAKNMIFTIKLQGKIDLQVIQTFQSIPNARVLHLFYNKHEVTFFYHSESKT